MSNTKEIDLSHYEEQILKHRRELHKIPEIAFKEFKTNEYILQFASKFGGIFCNDDEKREDNCFRIYTAQNHTGIILKYLGADDLNEKFTAFRADMDALYLDEKIESDFKSTHKGLMHACGHDTHMAILLTLAEYIYNERPKKNLLLIFQPAEEGPAGGKLLVEEGLFDNFKVNEIYALHNNPDYPVGTIALNNGKMLAGTIEFKIELTGVGGHAAYPHKINDLNVAGASLVMNLQTITSRSLDPIHENVLSIGYVRGGDIANVLPEIFTIKGTARSYSKDDLSTIKRRIEEITAGISKAYNVDYDFVIVSEYIPTINHEKIFDKINYLLDNESGNIKDMKLKVCKPQMTGEDFGFMLDVVPGAIFWLGVKNKDNLDNYGLHNPKYNPNEDGLIYGFRMFKEIIEK